MESIVRVWDTKTGECISTLEGHDDAVQDILLVSPESDRKKKKDATAPPVLSNDPPILPHAPGIPSTLSSAGSSAMLVNDFHLGTGELITASKDKTIKVWDLKVKLMYPMLSIY